MQTWLQQRLVGAFGQGLGATVEQRMKTCHHAAAFVQRPNRIDAAGETNVQMQLPLRLGVGLLQGVLAQCAQCLVVAGVERDHMN